MAKYNIHQVNNKGNNIIGSVSDKSCPSNPPQLGTSKGQRPFLDNKKIFIVHGHDELSKYKLKDYLQNTLHYPEPVILSEIASQGRTIIESFEEESENAGLVFVLLTPDDFTNDSHARARQNVIFELGYFMGKLGRKSGRIIALLKGNVDIPSDLNGILYIHIDNGIQAAGEEIRKAIESVE